jgi:hypothetical protein
VAIVIEPLDREGAVAKMEFLKMSLMGSPVSPIVQTLIDDRNLHGLDLSGPQSEI